MTTVSGRPNGSEKSYEKMSLFLAIFLTKYGEKKIVMGSYTYSWSDSTCPLWPSAYAGEMPKGLVGLACDFRIDGMGNATKSGMALMSRGADTHTTFRL
jgi:hypothetical protein